MTTPPSDLTTDVEAPRDAAALFRTHRVPMARLAFVLTGRSAVADEIVQEAFLKVHQNWPRLDNPIGYLRVAVVNGCHTFHRRRIVEERHAIHVGPPPPEAVNEGLGDVGHALARLPERQRTALALRYLLDLSDNDIAVALDVRPATVRSLIRRGLAALRQDIEK